MKIFILRLVFVATMLLLGAPLYADNCGSKDDCKVGPGNNDVASGLGGAGAVTGVLIGVAAGRKPKPKPKPEEEITFDPASGLVGGEKPPKAGGEEGEGDAGSGGDLFGTKPPKPTGPPDGPLGADPPKPKPTGPPDGELGADPPQPPPTPPQ